MLFTLLLLQKSDCLQLFDHVRKGVGDDGDHDEEGEDQDEDGGHDGLDILECDATVLQDCSTTASTEWSTVTREDRTLVIIYIFICFQTIYFLT